MVPNPSLPLPRRSMKMITRPMRKDAVPKEISAMPEMPKELSDRFAYEQALAALDLNELLKDTDLNELLKGLDLNKLLSAYDVTDKSGKGYCDHFIRDP